MSELAHWVGLSIVPDVGPVMSKRLLARMENPENIFKAGIDDLLSVKGMTREKAMSIRKFSAWDSVEGRLQDAKREGIRIVGYHDSGYPDILRETEGSPIVLYMKGEYLPDDRFAIAVVGSRRNSHYGEMVTRKIAGELSSSGFTIVSGMARGIDTLSHRSALAAGGRTIAVLGSGIDIAYPPENKGLMEKVTSSGCLISEFPPGTEPSRENFPRRNRLISGLSLGVLVVEATRESGSLITAKYALEQNREVFAVPGSIISPSSAGTNRLIKQGARIVLETDDILEELAPVLKGFIRMKKDRVADISEEEGKVCDVLTREPKHIDLLSREAAMPVQRLLDLMLSLELKGVVRQSDGKRFYLS